MNFVDGDYSVAFTFASDVSAKLRSRMRKPVAYIGVEVGGFNYGSVKMGTPGIK